MGDQLRLVRILPERSICRGGYFSTIWEEGEIVMPCDVYLEVRSNRTDKAVAADIIFVVSVASVLVL